MTELHTGRAAGTLTDCPELVILETAPLPPNVYAHVDVCDACQLVFELLDGDEVAVVLVEVRDKEVVETPDFARL